MEKLDKDSVRAFVERGVRPPSVGLIWNNMLFASLFGVPIAVFGAHSAVTCWTLLPLFAALLGGAINLSFGFAEKRPWFFLWRAIWGAYMSMVFVWGAYKLLSLMLPVPGIAIPIVLAVDALCAVASLRLAIRRIQRGGFFTEKSNAQLRAGGVAIAAAASVAYFSSQAAVRAGLYERFGDIWPKAGIIGFALLLGLVYATHCADDLLRFQLTRFTSLSASTHGPQP
jgi:hypothetical protein